MLTLLSHDELNNLFEAKNVQEGIDYVKLETAESFANFAKIFGYGAPVVPRHRRSFISLKEPVYYAYGRCGGGNFDEYSEEIDDIHANAPNFLGDYDCTFDETFREFYYELDREKWLQFTAPILRVQIPCEPISGSELTSIYNDEDYSFPHDILNNDNEKDTILHCACGKTSALDDNNISPVSWYTSYRHTQ